MVASRRILLVEDDPLISSSLARALAAQGYAVAQAADLAAAESAVAHAPPSLVICDLGLPDGDGLDLVTWLHRERPGVPVVVLTARGEEVDVVVGLSQGAVDYVTKPFRLPELLARVAAHLRFAGTRSERSERIVAGDVEIDVAARRVHVGGREVALRPKEFDLLVRLAGDAGSVVRREDLMSDVWDEHWWGPTKTLDVHCNSLRRHLGERPGERSRITSVRGVGYRFDGR